MKVLRELIQFARSKSLEFHPPEGLESKLYEGILSGSYKDELDATQDIYNEDTKSKRYRWLKIQLKERLYNAIGLMRLDKSDHSAYLIAINECYNKLRIVRLLLSFSMRLSGERLARNTLKKATEYELTEVIHECARILRQHYTLIGERKKRQEMSDLVRESGALLLAEDKASDCVEEMALEMVKPTQSRPEQIKEFIGLKQQIADIRTSFDSYTINLAYFRACQIYEQASNNHDGVIQCCDEAIQYFRERMHLGGNPRILEFTATKATMFTLKGDYKNARFSYTLCTRHAREGTVNWFKFQEKICLLSLHLGEYWQANDVLNAVKKHRRFKALSGLSREPWNIYEAYFLYAMSWQEYLPSFENLDRVERLIENLPHIQKEKIGYNISLLVLEIMLYAKRGEIDTIEDKMESLQVYNSTYLRKNEKYRSQIFLRMLLLLAKESGVYKKVEQKSRRWLEKLHQASNVLDSCEIIPYEQLWEWVLESLRTADTDADTRRKQAVQRKVS